MNHIKLDLSKNATRQYLLSDLLDRLGEVRRLKVEAALDKANVPLLHHHDLAAVLATIEKLPVNEKVKQDAQAVYEILASAEAKVHECSVEETHFHEVGKGEAIRNVIGVCLAFEALAPHRVSATPVQAGKGKVQCAHGLLDIPAPATAAILAQGIPVTDEKIEGEWCTPTSAALILHFVDDFSDDLDVIP